MQARKKGGKKKKPLQVPPLLLAPEICYTPTATCLLLTLLGAKSLAALARHQNSLQKTQNTRFLPPISPTPVPAPPLKPRISTKGSLLARLTPHKSLNTRDYPLPHSSSTDSPYRQNCFSSIRSQHPQTQKVLKAAEKTRCSSPKNHQHHYQNLPLPPPPTHIQSLSVSLYVSYISLYL